MNTIFVFAYYSFKDPVFQSAVLPYIKLTSSTQLNFILLTWERQEFQMDEIVKLQLRRDLQHCGITWYETSWHSGRLKILKKAFDMVKGLVYSMLLIRRHKAKKIYSEGFPGAIIGHYLSKMLRIPHIIHTFEPHADYMMEAGIWNQKSWEYRLLKNLEIPIANHAQHVITATKEYKNVLLERGAKSNICVIPSCIDTSFYQYLPRKREEIRSHMGLKSDQIVIVYLGKLGGMYMDEELFRFFNQCLQHASDKFFFFLFTNDPVEKIVQSLKFWKIPLSKVFFKFLAKDEVPCYLSAADIGFCGIRPIKSRRFSSPIKNGEYWACGLPTLIPQGISDDYIHAVEAYIGFTFNDVSEIDLSVLKSLKAIDRHTIQEKAFVLRGLARYKQTYLTIFNE